MTKIATLWDHGAEADWRRTLEQYWDHVKPTHLLLEQEMEVLEAEFVRQMDAEAWFAFLLHKYFKWKYTAANRYGSTTKALKRHAEVRGLDDLLTIKKALFAEAPVDVRTGLSTTMRIGGLGTAGASGLLSLLFPDRYGTVDQFVVKALAKVPTLPELPAVTSMKPEGLSVRDGIVLIEVMARKARSLNERFSSSFWTPRRVDKILWVVDR